MRLTANKLTLTSTLEKHSLCFFSKECRAHPEYSPMSMGLCPGPVFSLRGRTRNLRGLGFYFYCMYKEIETAFFPTEL